MTDSYPIGRMRSYSILLHLGQMHRPGYRVSKMHLMFKKFNLLKILTMRSVVDEINLFDSMVLSIENKLEMA